MIEILKIVIGVLSSLKLFDIMCKYAFDLSYRGRLKRHRFISEQKDLEKLIELFKAEKKLSEKTHPSILQAKVNTIFRTDKYSYLLVFKLLEVNNSVIKYSINDIKGAWLFVNIDRKMNISYKITKKKAIGWQNFFLCFYVLLSIILLLLILNFYLKFIEITHILGVIAILIILLMFLCVYIGKQLTQTIYVYSIFEE